MVIFEELYSELKVKAYRSCGSTSHLIYLARPIVNYDQSDIYYLNVSTNSDHSGYVDAQTPTKDVEQWIEATHYFDYTSAHTITRFNEDRSGTDINENFNFNSKSARYHIAIGCTHQYSQAVLNLEQLVLKGRTFDYTTVLEISVNNCVKSDYIAFLN